MSVAIAATLAGSLAVAAGFAVCVTMLVIFERAIVICPRTACLIMIESGVSETSSPRRESPPTSCTTT